jgi:hypothetical protein
MATTSPYSTRFKLVASAVVAVAIVGLIIAFSTLSSGNKDPVLTAGDANMVENLVPRRNSQVPQQSTVGIDLATGWTGVLQLNGVEIPQDQLKVTPQIGLIEYAPGPDKEVESFRTGQNCVTAVIWQISDGRGVSDHNINWCFEVV